MLRRGSPFLAAFVVALIVLAISCAPDQVEPTPGAASAVSPEATPESMPEVAGARATPRPPVTPTLPLAGIIAAAPPHVTVSDQFVRGGIVVVDQAIVPSDGWVVIYESLSDGAPGDVVGNARIGAQLNIQVSVPLGATFDEPTQLVAMLHENTADPDSFDFPDGDPPFTQNGRPVIDRFTVRPSQ